MFRLTICMAITIALSTTLQAQLPTSKSLVIGDIGSVEEVQNPQQLLSSLLSPLPKPEGIPKANPDGLGSLRDIKTIETYEKVAPAVVYVTDGKTGSGTGFFIHEDGWILTNHHVIKNMPVDSNTGVPVARIVWGQLDSDGMMQVAKGYLLADIFIVDPIRDLALLKLRTLPSGIKKLPFIQFAENSPPVGETCIAIGHPSLGVLWTLRRGEVSGQGRFPQDQIGQRLLGTDADKTEQKVRKIKDSKSPKVLLSSCGLNPGDSGGPLVNEKGKLIAVSFAVPLIDVENRVNLQNFSYHRHLDEVRDFLRDWPQQPVLQPTSHLPSARVQKLGDLDKDSIPDTISFAMKPKGEITGMLIDLDQDSLAGTNRNRINKAGLDVESDWDFEFAFTLSPQLALFYDRDNNGEIDWVTLIKDGKKISYKLASREWKMAPEGLTSPPFQSQALNERYEQFIKIIN